MGKQTEQRWLAWAAGLFEGEGWVGLCGARSGVRMQISSADPDVLKRFCEVVKCGHVSGPRMMIGRKPLWTWCCHGWEPAARLEVLFGPFLGERRRAQFAAAREIGVRSRPRRYRRHVPEYEAEEEPLLQSPLGL